MPENIKDAFPDLTDTEKNIKFTCPECKTVNGTTIHTAINIQYVVCGACWTKFLVSEVEEIA